MKPEQPPSAEATVIQRLLVGLVGAVCRCPWLVLAAALALCGLGVYASLTRLEYRTQRSDLINPNKDYFQPHSRFLFSVGTTF